ncbi:MAG: hypothetical protein D6732_12930 [Methanobacteriota archaeon]|nr:MAG: hypothetical protein D6732_12930 [Euryarchaeota archaeon]
MSKFEIDYFDSDPWTGIEILENGKVVKVGYFSKPFEELESFFNKTKVNYSSVDEILDALDKFDKGLVV